MAWKKRFSGYGTRARSYGGRAGGYAKSYASKRGIKPALSTPFIVGVAAGLMGVTSAIPADVTVGVACAPVRGIGTLKAGAQGVLFGRILQNRLGFLTGGSSTGGFIGD